MDFDVLACIGRFQIFQNGHRAMVDRGLEISKVVALVIGSDDQPRDARNPFTSAERIGMITAVYPQEVASGRIVFLPQINTLYNDTTWVNSVRKSVISVANKVCGVEKHRIGLIGHAKDATSFYLGIFPGWTGVEVPNVAGINATDIRNEYFRSGRIMRQVLPEAVASWLDLFYGCPAYFTVQQDILFNDKYKKPYKKLTTADLNNFVAEFDGLSKSALLEEFSRQYRSPYAPTFHTVDAVLTQSNHILLVKRGAMPGKGLWALPGGFLEQDETLRNGMLRELVEETEIALSKETLDRCIRSWRTFDDPNRSGRGRTITTAFHVVLRNSPEFPKVAAADDAADVWWAPMEQVTRNIMFEDHFDIICTMLGGV